MSNQGTLTGNMQAALGGMVVLYGAAPDWPSPDAIRPQVIPQPYVPEPAVDGLTIALGQFTYELRNLRGELEKMRVALEKLSAPKPKRRRRK